MRVRDAALIRKLCGLGLPAQSLVQSLLPALREIITAHSGGVFWVDAEGQMTALYAERLLQPEAMASYYDRHYQDAVEGFAAAFSRRAQRSDPVSTHSYSGSERGTDYFREVLRPLDAYHVLYAILAFDGMPYAQLSLYRGEHDEPFGGKEQRTLGSLLHYLSPALRNPHRPPAGDERWVLVEESIGIVAASGQIVSAAKEWRRLVRLAALSELSPSQAGTESRQIALFLQSFTFNRRPADAKGLPAETIRQTPWGRFVIRVFALDGVGGNGGQTGFLIRREEPRALSLIRGSGQSPLSPQQREVALLLADGMTNPEIAHALNLSLNTASYHVKQVYSRLDVNDRGSVENRLLDLAREVMS